MGAYDPQRTNYVASRDKKGHSSSLRVNVPTGVMQALGELVASRQVIYLKTPQDCLRDALGRWLDWMVNEGGLEMLRTDMALYHINEAMDRDAELREHNRETVARVEAELRNAKTPFEIEMSNKRAQLALLSLQDEAYRFQVEGLIERFGQ